MNKDINNLTNSILAFFPKFFGNPQEWEYGNGKSAEKDINKIIKLAEKVKKEIKKSDDASKTAAPLTTKPGGNGLRPIKNLYSRAN